MSTANPVNGDSDRELLRTAQALQAANRATLLRREQEARLIEKVLREA